MSLTRTRSKGEPSQSATGYIANNDVPLVHTNRTYNVSAKSQTMEDVVTPNFWSRIRAGEIINNPCELEYSSRQSGGGIYTQQYGSSNYTVPNNGRSCTLYWAAFRGFNPVEVELEVDYDLHETKAKLKALSEVDSSPYAFLEDIGELRETYRLILNPLGSLRKLSRAFNRDVSGLITQKKFLTQAQAVSQVWLTYRNGVLPLWRSIEDLIRSKTEKREKLPPRLTARGFSQDDDSSFTNPEYNFGGQIETWSVYSAETYQGRAYIIYEVDNPIRDWRFTYGLRLKDIPETMWALAPHSYIVDRVVNVSDIIRATTNLSDPRVRILGGGYVVKRHRNTLWYLQSIYYSGASSSVSADTVADISGSYSRAPWWPSISDVLKAPVEYRGLVRDAQSTLDLVALIVQGLTKF